MNECFDVGIAPKKTIYLSVYVLIKKKNQRAWLRALVWILTATLELSHVLSAAFLALKN